MTHLKKSIYKFSNKFDTAAARFTLRHPYMGFAAMFIGMPIFILGAVCVSTTVIILPISLIFGWV
ncbi:hypothetical protein [Frisingicoccus sp.]|uniref:hypothetical protein n=1 Tax=Frisingicoccus sp. TaxID=1918627 RepID=UPI003AB2B375